MATFVVTHVHRELAPNGTHRHIAGIRTEAGDMFTCQQVIDSIERGDIWKTRVKGEDAVIRKLRYCPRPTCLASPYIRTRPDARGRDLLEELPEC